MKPKKQDPFDFFNGNSQVTRLEWVEDSRKYALLRPEPFEQKLYYSTIPTKNET